MSLVFYSKCKPQGCNAVKIALKYDIVFIGYPVLNNEAAYDVENTKQYIIPFTDKERIEKSTFLIGKQGNSPYKRITTQYRGLAENITKGDYVLIPDLPNGQVHIGKIASPFEIADRPAWGKEYMGERLSQKQKTDNPYSHYADVAQIWRVEEYRDVRFSALPRILSQQLLSRTTAGYIHNRHSLEAFVEIKKFYNGENTIDLELTNQLEKIQARLDYILSPSIFEHLCVDLLQLENIDERWVHVGGSGDGGIDGIGTNIRNGNISVLQCKLRSNKKSLKYEANKFVSGAGTQYLAWFSLESSEDIPKDACTSERVVLMDREHIAKLVLKHAKKLPIARTLNIAGHP